VTHSARGLGGTACSEALYLGNETEDLKQIQRLYCPFSMAICTLMRTAKIQRDVNVSVIT